MKPGTIIKVKPESNYYDYALVIMVDSLDELRTTVDFPEKKQIPQNEVGFIVSIPDSNETMFDWLVEVSFPDFGLQGWIQKNDIILVNP